MPETAQTSVVDETRQEMLNFAANIRSAVREWCQRHSESLKIIEARVWVDESSICLVDQEEQVTIVCEIGYLSLSGRHLGNIQGVIFNYGELLCDEFSGLGVDIATQAIPLKEGKRLESDAGSVDIRGIAEEYAFPTGINLSEFKFSK